jgi:hypothetical protein
MHTVIHISIYKRLSMGLTITCWILGFVYLPEPKAFVLNLGPFYIRYDRKTIWKVVEPKKETEDF